MPTENLYVESFTETKTGWTRVGNDPWLNAQDQPSNYVWTESKKAEIGDWDFANSTHTSDTLNSVALYVYGQTLTGVKRNTFYIYDGTSWTEASLPMLPTSWGWVNVNISSILDTWTKVNAAQLYIEHANSNDHTDVDAAYLLVDYTEAGPTTYTKTFDTDVLFKKLGIDKTRQIDIMLQKKGIQKAYQLDTLFKGIIEKTANIDTLFKKLGEEQSLDIDTLFKKLGIEKTFGIDTYILLRIFKDVLLDVVLKKLGEEKAIQLDTLLKKLDIEKAFNIDVILSPAGQTFTKAFSIDTFFKQLSISKLFGIDVFLGEAKVTKQKGFGIDVRLAKIYTAKLPLFITLEGQLVIPLNRKVIIKMVD